MKDGKTEWILMTYEEIEDGIMLVKQAMQTLFEDCDSEYNVYLMKK
jgi:hypothetical protein